MNHPVELVVKFFFLMYTNFVSSVKRIICVFFCVVLAAGEVDGILILAYCEMTFLIGH
jgi:hypothetical protein